jgi:hypothetical protein
MACEHVILNCGKCTAVSVQCCALYGGEEGPSCSNTQTRKARKPHRCCECRETINAGDRYEYMSGVWDGRPHAFKTCLLCVEIRNHFACRDGWEFGAVWEQLQESFFPGMKAGGPCMKGLSPEAKARLFERRLKWMEDSQ